MVTPLITRPFESCVLATDAARVHDRDVVRLNVLKLRFRSEIVVHDIVVEDGFVSNLLWRTKVILSKSWMHVANVSIAFAEVRLPCPPVKSFVMGMMGAWRIGSERC